MDRNLAATRSGRFSILQFAALLLVPLVLRGGILWRFGDNLAEDRDNYRGIARHVAAGDGFVDPHTLFPTAYRPPLYPLFLAAVLVCGAGDAGIGLAQLALGVATVGLTILAGRRLGLGRSALVAGLLVAVDPLLLHQTALVMTETLAAFLAALVVWLSAGRPSWSRSLILGVVFGLCCLCRPAFWAFGGLAVAAWLMARILKRRSPGSLSLRERVRVRAVAAPASISERSPQPPEDGTPTVMICVALGIIAVIAPWGIRNALVMGRPIVTTTHGGYTLLLAHNPAYTRAVVERPWGAVWEGESFNEWAASLEAELARENPPLDATHLSPAVELARDDWMNRKAWAYMREEPVVAVKSGLTLLGRLWNVAPLTAKGTQVSNRVRLAIGVFYSAVFVAMIAGLVRLPRPAWQKWWPLAALILSFTAVHALYWADMRMRAPLVPAITLLAAASGGLRENRGGAE